MKQMILAGRIRLHAAGPAECSLTAAHSRRTEAPAASERDRHCARDRDHAAVERRSNQLDHDRGSRSVPRSFRPPRPETHPDDGPAPEIPSGGTAPKVFTLGGLSVNFVQIPFTVKDSKGRLVPGLTWRDTRVFENGVRQHMSYFTVDPFPLSVALVIDQSVTFDTMTKINNALAALQGAFSPYDQVAVFTYNNGPQMRTDFTAAQSARLAAVLEQSKGSGRDPVMGLGGPLAQTTNINNQQFDPEHRAGFAITPA